MATSDRVDALPLTLATVCFLQRDDRVLLQERAAGRRWAGRLRGPGDKRAPGESADAAIVREMAEETGSRPLDPTMRGELDLIFGAPPAECMQVVVFTAEQWTGRTRGGREGRLR